MEDIIIYLGITAILSSLIYLVNSLIIFNQTMGGGY